MKVTKPGDVFIEISRSYGGTGNLVYSTSPYNLLITTGAAVTPTTTIAITPTVTPAATPVTVKPAGNELVTNGYVTAKGGGIIRDAGTITVNVPGFGLLLAIAALGTAILIRKRK